ncbi:MAG: ferritin family protein [Desulfocapsaceae bacterium]|jgi:rubrerythrin|nr:ferritin family protein [Desulfocapsaceae bacterium]
MAFDFNADEIFEMAEQMERNGAHFYRDAAESIADGKNKELLLRLADMEVEHEKTFMEMRTSLTDQDKQNSVFDPEGETVQYLKALVDTRVFFKKDIDTTSMRDILKEALLAEKDAIVFYLGMKELVPEARGKSHLEQIIKEEMEHIKLIGRELSAAAS